MDKEDWIMQRCEELASEKFDKPYEELSDEVQMQLWAEAEQDYINREASRIDAAYDAALENQIMEGEHGNSN